MHYRSYLGEHILSSISLSHSSTALFVENVNLLSTLGKEAYCVWNELVANGKLREISGPHILESNTHSICEGQFIVDNHERPVYISFQYE